MKKVGTIVLAVVLMVASKYAFSAQSPAVITGVILDAGTNEPMTGVRVTLGAPGTSFSPLESRIPAPQATTDAQGRFSIETRETGRFRLVPAKDGWTFSVPGQTRAPTEPGVWVQIADGTRIQGVQMFMARPAVITGRVVTAEGQPIVGTAGSVSLLRYSYGNDGKRDLRYVPGVPAGTTGALLRTNDQGEFRFYDVPPGEYYLCAIGGGSLVIGGPIRSCFPGPREEAKAIPIRVNSGDEQRLGTLSMLPRPKGVEVKLRVSGLGESDRRSVRFVDPVVEMSSLNSINPGVIAFSVMPGRYETVVTTDTFTNLRYAFVELDAANSTFDQEVILKPAPRIAVKLLIENAAGERVAAPQSIRCSLRSRFGSPSCRQAQALPGTYELDLQDLPYDAYVLSAKAGDRDFLAEGLNISRDTEMEVVLAAPGAVVEGTVRAAAGNSLGNATVALVPDAPYRRSWVRYRSVVTDPGGKFEIHGIAPGTYKLFAWPELEGAAYRNAEFMKEFEERGKPVKLEKGARQTLDLTAF